MPQSLVKNLIHLVYSTKHRKPWLPNEVRENLFAYQSGIFKQWESPAIVVGGVEDHVHALFALSKNRACVSTNSCADCTFERAEVAPARVGKGAHRSRLISPRTRESSGGSTRSGSVEGPQWSRNR